MSPSFCSNVSNFKVRFCSDRSESVTRLECWTVNWKNQDWKPRSKHCFKHWARRRKRSHARDKCLTCGELTNCRNGQQREPS